MITNAIHSLLFLLCLKFIYGNVVKLENKNADTSFDLIIFTQHWPQTVCFAWKEKSDDHICSLPDQEEWSIHGIWPTKFHSIGPQFCNPSLRFNESAIQPLEVELKEKWINIEAGTKQNSLWRHEWEKHGTCSAVLEELKTETKYFQAGLNLFDEYDMKAVLAKANIMPGQKYTVQNFLDGIKKVLGINAQIMCIEHEKTKEPFLFEARICFDKMLKLIDCDGIAAFPTNCDKSSVITYPSTVPFVYEAIQIL